MPLPPGKNNEGKAKGPYIMKKLSKSEMKGIKGGTGEQSASNCKIDMNLAYWCQCVCTYEKGPVTVTVYSSPMSNCANVQYVDFCVNRPTSPIFGSLS